MIGQEKVYETLKALGIEFDYLEHPEAPTIEIARQYWKKFGQYHIVRICFSGIIRETGITWLFFIGDRNLAIHDLEQLLKQGKLSLLRKNGWRNTWG